MIRILMFVGPILFTLLQIIVLIFYRLDETHSQIIAKLSERNINNAM
ncbi:hypothetical protein [Lederbergia ruris]